MSDELSVVMLGHSGVGKTTYVASMYGLLQRPINGFTIKASDGNDHRQLIATYRAIQDGSWPAPTDRHQEYRFVLRHNREPVMDFTWTDYRGGALREKTDSSDTLQLLKDLEDAYAVLMFCDAQTILDRTRRGEIARMTQLVARSVKNRDFPTPLGIIYTKCDLVDQGARTEKKLIAPVDGLIQSIQASELVSGTIIPIACGLNAFNVELPVLFALHHGITLLGLALYTEMGENLQHSQDLRSTGWLRRIGENTRRIFNGEPTIGKEADYADAQAAEAYLALLPLIEPAQALGEYLKDLETF